VAGGLPEATELATLLQAFGKRYLLCYYKKVRNYITGYCSALKKIL